MFILKIEVIYIYLEELKVKFDSYGNTIEIIDFDDDEKVRCLFTKNSNFIKDDDNYLIMDDNYNVNSVDGSGHFSIINYM